MYLNLLHVTRIIIVCRLCCNCCACILKGRGGKGSIYVWAAGNGGEAGDSCAADGYVNSIYTIAIGAANSSGFQSEYDEVCSGKFTVTFVDGPNTTTAVVSGV